MSYAILFPGQGSQAVGMGSDVFAARPDLLGAAADAVLGWSLRDLCLEGPEDELTRTERAQPALYAVAYVLWDELRPRLVDPPRAASGHSLGEYTALAAAGALAFEEGLRLVAARGRAMASAADAENSSKWPYTAFAEHRPIPHPFAAGRQDMQGSPGSSRCSRRRE